VNLNQGARIMPRPSQNLAVLAALGTGGFTVLLGRKSN